MNHTNKTFSENGRVYESRSNFRDFFAHEIAMWDYLRFT